MERYSIFAMQKEICFSWQEVAAMWKGRGLC